MNFNPNMFNNIDPNMMKNMSDMIGNMSDADLNNYLNMTGNIKLSNHHEKFKGMRGMNPEMLRASANMMKNMNPNQFNNMKNMV